MYPPELYEPMKEDLTSVGFEEMLTATDVESAFSKEGTTFFVINSVCGCAAGNARPAAKYVVQHSSVKPTRAVTSFAGVDKEAVNKVRELTAPYPPSSPSMGLIKDGKLVHFIERLSIEGRSAQDIAQELLDTFEQHCS